MVNYQEILRLHSLGYSQRNIIQSLHCSCHTIKDVVDAAKTAGVSWPFDKDITNKDLETILFPNKHKKESIYEEPDYAYIHRELARHGVNLSLLWEEYCRSCLEGKLIPYKYTQFCVKYNKWARITKATMRIAHKPGNAIEIDWAGDTISYYDAVTGYEYKAYLFIAVLPCSCKVYAEACQDMATENWLCCHVNAFNYFDGVTRLLTPDNCKTSTIANNRYEIIYNQSYYELAEHYGTALLPTRVRKPKDKSHAEGSVDFAETWIIAALRNKRFFSFDEVKAAVKDKLEDLNNRPFKQRPGCRNTAYEEEEKEFMRPLPAQPFEPAIWSTAKVPNDYLVTDGLNKYSVPYNLIGEQVNIKVTRYMVEVFFHEGLVASHLRYKTRQHDPIVKEDHMPQEHRKYLYYNSESFLSWAATVGPKTMEVVNFFLSSGKVPEQGYKACVSLNKLANRYSPKRIENACERNLEFSSQPSIRNITSILKNGQDKPVPHLESNNKVESSKYGITRGAAYYKRGDEQK